MNIKHSIVLEKQWCP